MKYLLKSPYSALIKTENNFFELSKNDSLEIEDENMIFVYPQQSGYLPFCINLSQPNENRFFSIKHKNENQYIFLELQMTVEVFQKESFSLSGKTINVEISKNKLTFESDNKKICVPHNMVADEIKLFKHKNFVCCQSKHDFFAYCTDTEKLSHFSGDKIEFCDDKLMVSKSFNDSDGRQRISTYSFDNNLKKEDEKFLRRSVLKNSELIPYKLMESVQAKDFDFAYDCLNDKLKSKIDKSQIEKFFGSFSCFMPLSTSEFITIASNQKNYIKIDLVGDKVYDISIDKL